jgi:pyruvate/2-oxoglutarate dehydrogenase complex dihydrolipoamide acyltransferase (E2) component
MTQVMLPKLSLAMEEGTLARWLVADGDRVRAGQPIAEVETDKAVAEVEAPVEGTLRHLVREGSVIRVEAAMAEIF